MELNNVKDITVKNGFGQVGYMNDGTTVLARSTSSAKSNFDPTLEIQYGKSPIDNRDIKIRYTR